MRKSRKKEFRIKYFYDVYFLDRNANLERNSEIQLYISGVD